MALLIAKECFLAASEKKFNLLPTYIHIVSAPHFASSSRWRKPFTCPFWLSLDWGIAVRHAAAKQNPVAIHITLPPAGCFASISYRPSDQLDLMRCTLWNLAHACSSILAIADLACAL